MAGLEFFNKPVETMDRTELDALIDERVRYTIAYADEHSPFYHHWFKEHRINPEEITTHEDLLDLPIISGVTIREHQPPVTQKFEFKSVPLEQVFTIHETSGTTGIPKSLFLTWQDWQRYAEKYARTFVSQGIGPGDRVVVCASYGMNVGANTMTLAAHRLKFTVIPEGSCTFPTRVIKSYQPTVIIGSVFKLLHLAERMKNEGLKPEETGIKKLIVGGEGFADEARQYVSTLWGCPIYNTYGSTEGTMCGECKEQTGLHVPEDLVHLDLYDPAMQKFVDDGDRGRIVLTNLLPVDGKTGTLLINYDTEDTTIIRSQGQCVCGRTHIRIEPPMREAETKWIGGTWLNRVDIEQAVFHPENMQDLTGEYEAFLYGGGDQEETMLRVSMECRDPVTADKRGVEERFLATLLSRRTTLREAVDDLQVSILFNFTSPGGLELAALKGRPRRFVDRR
ncbi:coenzyme F390 synthetase [Methanosphaerula palustris]|uniref:Coenzyme F390 synthetase n=1 Tax=Methanosphaerula palustris (strain ATCC BAA-1556 / DSM 19958 / E1-9c) TaxID=521011 RepID=B8GJZ0_METPE|nr:coenzyme F390 synthetase [Methanosphaerula palustris]ACL17061.1 coenzyme F390 synthetase [Methanosphaerula palustris E1-9c]